MKYEVLKRDALFQGFFALDRLHLRHELFEGGWTPPFTREILLMGQGAILLPFDPQRDVVVLIEQFRLSPIEYGENPWFLQAVAGFVDPNETPEAAARREGREESGCEISDLFHVMNNYPVAGCSDHRCSLYIGRTTAPAEGIYGLKEEVEDIRVHVLPASKAIELLYAKKIQDPQTAILLHWFALKHTELRSRWLVSEASTPII